MQIQGVALSAVGADAEFTVTLVGVERLRSVNWTAAGPDWLFS